MARYETMREKRNIPDGTAVWAYAFEETDAKRGMHLKQIPIKGTVINRPGRRPVFIPFRKGSETEYAMSKAMNIDSRHYADTKAEAIDGYNALIKTRIDWYKEKIAAFENEII